MLLIFKKYKIYILVIISILMNVSCFTHKKSQYTYVTFKDLKNRPIVKVQLPKDFITERYGTSKSCINYYNYPDSSIVYIDGETSNGLNYENIRVSGQYYELFDKYHSNDSLTLSGTDSSGKFWKNIVIDGYSFGYIHVSTVEKKNQLDSCLNNTIKFIRKK